MISDEQAAEWRELADAATEGPWDTDRLFIAHNHAAEDAAFIAAARTAVPALLAERERLTAEAERHKDFLFARGERLEARAEKAEAEVQRLAALIPGPTETVEHGLMRAGVLVYGPSKFPRWNQYMTYAEAIERWYPGAKHVRRVHTDPDTYTEWEEVTDE